MTRKFTLVFAFVFSIFLLAGCSKTKQIEMSDKTMNTGEDNIISEEKQPWKLLSLYNEFGNFTCKINISNELEMSGTFYVNDDKLFSDTFINMDWWIFEQRTLDKDWKAHSRWSLYWDWEWIILNLKWNIKDWLYEYEQEENIGNIEMTCEPGIEESIDFDIPDWIIFTEIDY